MKNLQNKIVKHIEARMEISKDLKRIDAKEETQNSQETSTGKNMAMLKNISASLSGAKFGTFGAKKSSKPKLSNLSNS